MVAPEDPVPLRRNTTLDDASFSFLKFSINPWLNVCDPSTGSVYLFDCVMRVSFVGIVI